MTNSSQKKWHSLGNFLKAKEEREKEEAQPSIQPTPATQGTDSTLGTLPTQGSQPPVAPTRDFMKVANSISRSAVPSGLFTGKSKQIYDFLYSRSRGAIQPVKSIRLKRREIMEGAHVGSDKTLRENLIRLRNSRLISWTEDIGAHAGNIYTVFLPEEAQASLATQGTLGTLGTEGYPGYFLPTVPRVETTLGSQGLIVDSTGTSGNPKTLYKTNTECDDDDAALAGLYGALKEAAREVTGRELSPADRDRWREVGEILATELKIAAARTTVSSVPSFLAEHLRRRLWKKDKGQLQAEAAAAAARPATTPKSPLSQEQIAKCPDCGGSGFFYPQGYEGGVAKCKHEQLASASTPEQKSSEQA